MSRVEQALADVLYGRAPPSAELLELGLHGDPHSVVAARRMVLSRRHRGTGGLREWYPSTLAAWLAANPGDAGLDVLAARFCASDACASWKEHAAPDIGICLEEALFHFFEAREIGDAATREDEMLSAVTRALAVAPAARFAWPSQLRRTSRGCVVVSRLGVLHAAIDGQYLRGPVTGVIAELIAGVAVEAVAATRAVPLHQVLLVQAELARQGLLAPPATAS
jgi:hypothetical protein